MKKYPLAALFLTLILSSVAFAQTSDKIILVSDTTSVDMLIAKAAGEKSGIPILVLEGGLVNETVKSELNSLRVRTVILVGGPAVIKPDVENDLSLFNIVRLWGLERTGTAVEVAKYFWQEGSPCVVMADDTKDSDADTGIQTKALQFAVNGNCPFIPVPKGKLPAQAVEIIRDLNVQEATFVGASASSEFGTKLASLNLKEITGSNNEIDGIADSEIEKSLASNATLKLVIIAAPHWRHILGSSSSPQRHTIVRIVSSEEAAPNLIALIKAKNIENVSVLGYPALANAIASQLQSQNISVTKISGAPGENSISALHGNMARWEEKRKQASARENSARAKVKQRLLSLTDRAQSRLDKLDKEFKELNLTDPADQRAASMIRNKIQISKSQLSSIRDYLDKGNEELAKTRIVKIVNDVAVLRWMNRVNLKINTAQELAEEES